VLSSFFSLSRSALSRQCRNANAASILSIDLQTKHPHCEPVYVHDLWRFNVSITDIRRQCARRCDFLLRALSILHFLQHTWEELL
jgi:hypothetical protein